jgi:sulfur carrier protein ThiS
MNINVKLVGLFRTGRFKQNNCDYPSATKVQDVINDLELPKQHFGIVLINGVHADVNTLLNEGDHLVLMPIVDGG